MSHELQILKLRAELLELGSTVRQFKQAGLDGVSAELLLPRKRAELEDVMTRRKHAKAAALVLRTPTQASPLLAAMAEMRLVTTRAQYTVPYMKERGSLQAIEAIRQAIDDFAECEMGTREFFWDKGGMMGSGTSKPCLR